MKQAAKLVLGLGITVGSVLALFLLPVVPIPVGYECEGPISGCSQLHYSTYASVSYASFSIGAVYVIDHNDGSFSQYCWMNGNPVGNPQINGGAMCHTAVG